MYLTCTIRKDLIDADLSVPIGDTYLHTSEPIPYRWLSDEDGFQVLHNNKWHDAYSIDFDFS